MNDLTWNVRAAFLATARLLGVDRGRREALASTISAQKVEVSLAGDFRIRLRVGGDTLEMREDQGEVEVRKVSIVTDRYGRERTLMVATSHKSLGSVLEYYALRG